jgi:exopolysaccharide biosynthesis polyprenyl glycosylphosphotransferase
MRDPDVAVDLLDGGAGRGRLLWEKRLLLALGDGVAVAIAFVLAFNLRSAEIRHEFFSVPWLPLSMTLATWYICANIADGYRLISAVNPRAAFSTAASALSLSFVALLGVFFIVPYRITRPTILLWLPLTATAVLAWRIFYQQIFAQGLFAGSLVIIAERKNFDRVWAVAAAGLPNLYRVLEVIDPKRPDLETRLMALAENPTTADIVIGFREEVPRDLMKRLVVCAERGVRLRFLADVFEEMTGRLLLEQLGYSWLMSLPLHSEAYRLYVVFKRAVDIVVATIGLVILAVLYPPIALVVMLEDGGPVFYRQARMGKFEQPFEILKFRTMYTSAKTAERQTSNDDPRVTRIGRLLRPLHFDELPQSINILRGDMSVVGPRPEQPQHAAMLSRNIEYYNLRLSVRPGLTGWAQVNFGYGAGVEGAREKLSYDLYYVDRKSLGLDLLIIAQTVRAIFSLRGR